MNDLLTRIENDQSNDSEHTESGSIGSSMGGFSAHTSNASDPVVSIGGDEDA